MIAKLMAYKKYLIILLIAGAFFWHYTNLLKTVGSLETVVKEEKKSHDATKESFQSFVAETEANFQRQQQIINERTEAFQRYEEDYNELQAIFSRHDLEKLFEAKPGLMERRINDGTERLFNDIRAISAFESQLNSGENGATASSPNNPP